MLTSNSWLEVGGDPDHDVNAGIFKGFLPLWDRGNSVTSADNWRSCRQILMNSF